jgi:glycosyltransferase involved in cell wall biosynthesis
MRITLLNQYYPPDEAATAQLLGDLGAALAAAGHEVRAICGDRGYADPSVVYPRRLTIDGVEVVRVRSTPFGRSSKIGRVIDYATYLLGAAARLLFGKKPDVVISLTTPPMISLAGSVAAHLRGGRSIFWSMDVYPDIAYELGAMRRDSLAGRLFGWLSRLSLRKPDVVVALGESMGTRLAAAGARRVEVIHNWADEASIEPRPARPRAPGDPLVVLYSGNLGLAHEFDTLLDAAARAQQEAIPVRFVFQGGGPRMREVREGVDRRGLANVEIRGYAPRETLGESLTDCDLHLVTLRERMPGLLVPSKIYGILAAGKPTLYIGPAEGEVYEILSEGRCGRRVGIGDVEGVVGALREYAVDPSLIQVQGATARALFDARFTKAMALEKWVALVEALAGDAAVSLNEELRMKN